MNKALLDNFSSCFQHQCDPASCRRGLVVCVLQWRIQLVRFTNTLFFGNVTAMNCSQLLTYGDVIKCIPFCKTRIRNEYGGKLRSSSRICNQLASDISSVYQRASVPIVSFQRNVKEVQMYHNKYQSSCGYINLALKAYTLSKR